MWFISSALGFNFKVLYHFFIRPLNHVFFTITPNDCTLFRRMCGALQHALFFPVGLIIGWPAWFLLRLPECPLLSLVGKADTIPFLFLPLWYCWNLTCGCYVNVALLCILVWQSPCAQTYNRCIKRISLQNNSLVDTTASPIHWGDHVSGSCLDSTHPYYWILLILERTVGIYWDLLIRQLVVSWTANEVFS